jgi:hypothetical protein
MVSFLRMKRETNLSCMFSFFLQVVGGSLKGVLWPRGS